MQNIFRIQTLDQNEQSYPALETYEPADKPFEQSSMRDDATEKHCFVQYEQKQAFEEKSFRFDDQSSAERSEKV